MNRQRHLLHGIHANGPRRTGFGAAAVFALVGLVVCCGGGTTTSPTPTTPSPGLDAAFAAARQLPNLTSLVVSHVGMVERQEFFNGGGANTPQDVRSVTKSVMSLLVGIALDRGCVRSLDETLGEALGPLAPADPAKAAVTVRSLLSMSSGIGGDELLDIGEYNRWAAAPDQLEYLWHQPAVSAPGTRFAYYSPAYHLLSPIVGRSCGPATAAGLARGWLFGPLGIGDRGWQTDNQGNNNGAAGLTLSPTDMVALGNLVISGGRSWGSQVVSPTWLRESTRMQVATSAQPYMSGYGFGWWTGQASGSDFAAANGYGGQFIIVVPRTALVVVATSRWQGLTTSAASAQWRAVLDIIMQRIVPAY
jgi:CubicO group peptidase (beta-lactamase class C family)